MSKKGPWDSVRFDLSLKSLTGSLCGTTLSSNGRRIYDALHATLGVCEDALRDKIRKAQQEDSDSITIICRPSQFGRFLIARNKAGAKNDFMGLNAELFLVEGEAACVMDRTGWGDGPRQYVRRMEELGGC